MLIDYRPQEGQTVQQLLPLLDPADLDVKYLLWRQTDNGRYVYKEFSLAALRYLHVGQRRLSAKRIVENLRPQGKDGRIPGRDAAGFKINNSFTSRLAREFMRAYPQYDRCFVTREQENRR